MSAPQLTVYVDGSGAINGDGLNTFCQTADTTADLRAFVGIVGVQIFMRGTAAPNDGGQGMFYWNSGSTAPDDNGVTTIVPYGSGSGAWTRLTGRPSSAASTTAGVQSTTSTSVVMFGLGGQIMPVITGIVLFIMTCEPSLVAGTLRLYYGTGPAPALGDAPPATATRVGFTYNFAFIGGSYPLTLHGLSPKLALGTDYWFDLGFASQGGTFEVGAVIMSAIEVG